MLWFSDPDDSWIDNEICDTEYYREREPIVITTRSYLIRME
jgi:hypothetical protein